MPKFEHASHRQYSSTKNNILSKCMSRQENPSYYNKTVTFYEVSLCMQIDFFFFPWASWLVFPAVSHYGLRYFLKVNLEAKNNFTFNPSQMSHHIPIPNFSFGIADCLRPSIPRIVLFWAQCLPRVAAQGGMLRRITSARSLWIFPLDPKEMRLHHCH